MIPVRSPDRVLRVAACVASVLVIAAALVAAPSRQASDRASAVTTSALSGAQFIAGDIIDDAHFFTRTALSQAQIQTFLTGQQRGCQNSSCLSVLKITTTSKAADSYCSAYQGATGETAAAMIYKVQVACGISAAVLLATLQKEQGLVTATAPTTSALEHAMGYLCPDTAPCDAGAAGLFSQVYGAARQFEIYRLDPGFFNFHADQTAAIQYNPSTSCGTETVDIRNAATAALYDYTPYVPNAAALANLDGIGDSCSAYGNRNFWVYYNSWFGSGTPPFGVVDGASVSSGKATVRGWAVDPALPLTPTTVTLQVTTPSGQTSSRTLTANQSRPDVGVAYPFTAESDGTTLHGFSTTFAESAAGQYAFCVTVHTAPGSRSGAAPVSLGCTYQWYSPATAAPTVGRLSGADRYDTAVAVSKASFPTAGVPVVYLASGTSYPDALAAGPAAAAQGGPLLLTLPTSVPKATVAELERLKPKRVVVVGGTAAISAGDAKAVASVTHAPVTRLAGANRFLTAEAIAKAVFPTATTAFAVSGLNYPDALSASSAAGVAKAPILLANGTSRTADGTLDAYLRSARTITSVRVVGGTSAITAAVAAGIQASGKKVTRYAGADRYLTSNAVSRAFFPKATTAYLATGAGFADALAGSVAAARAKAPLVVVQPSCVPSYDGQAMVSQGVSHAVLLGGGSALSSNVGRLAVCR